MPRRVFKPEQITGKLREAEVLLSQGATVGEDSRKLGSLSRPATVGEAGRQHDMAFSAPC